MAKVCKRCGERKRITDFYAHSQMADGHLNVCKPCFRKGALKYRRDNIEYVKAYDRERDRLPHRVALRKKLAPRYRDRRYGQRDPVKRAANVIVGNAIRDGRLQKGRCKICGKTKGLHAHHEDYAKPLEVTWLCRKHHGERHRELNEMERQKC